jgi:hypothetical protein
VSRIDHFLEEIERSGAFGDAWTRLYEGPLLLGETITEVTYAVLPRVVALAERQDPRTLLHFWWRIAFIVSNFNYPGIHSKPAPVPADLDEGFRNALLRAECLALQCFSATEWGEEASDLAIACLALSGHPVGCQIWQAPSPPREGRGDFVRFHCWECGADEVWFAHAGDGVAAAREDESGPKVPDLGQPAPQAPPVPDLSRWQRSDHPWNPLAGALDKPAGEVRTLCSDTLFPDDFTRRFGEHRGVAAAVARAGVPRETPNRAALSLLGVMVALSGAFDWAGRLLRLAGLVRCPECRSVDTWANCLANVPVDWSEQGTER